MHTGTRGRLLLSSAALALAACASSPPTQPPSSSTAQANLAMASHAAATSEATLPSDSGPKLKAGNGYRKVTKAGETYYCRKEVMTGSRTSAQVTCLTLAEMTALSQNSQDFLNGVRSWPGAQAIMGPNGGTINTAVAH
jgi:hypothetical protein